MIVYKYKSLGDSSCPLLQEKQLGFLRDIFKNNRLYAADFNILDDPMEGVFKSSRFRTDHIVSDIVNGKNGIHICSLSPTYQSMLMWSFYANYHTGYCVEVEIEENSLRNVEYVDDPICTDNGDFNELGNEEKIKTILSRKYKDWAFEKELRVLTRERFVNVSVNKVYFGCRVNNKLYEQLKREIEEKEIAVDIMNVELFNHINTNPNI